MDFKELFLSPLGKEYCYLYYMLMIYTLFQLSVVIIYSVVNIFITKKNDIVKTLFTTLFSISASALQYLFIRVAYSVCTKSL
jgi:hypothetical protein